MAELNLEQAVEQLVNLGEKDPLSIARKLQEQHGHEWLVAQLEAYAEDFVAEIARRMLGYRRRSRRYPKPGRPCGL